MGGYGEGWDEVRGVGGGIAGCGGEGKGCRRRMSMIGGLGDRDLGKRGWLLGGRGE